MAGGGLAVAYSDPTMKDTSFLYCGSRLKITGATGVSDCSPTFTNCSWLNCISFEGGGAIGWLYANKDETHTLTLIGCIFGSNVAAKDGGAVDAGLMVFSCINCSFFHNVASGRGGAVFSQNQTTLKNCVFIRNMINGSGKYEWNDLVSGGAVMQSLSSIKTIDVEDVVFNQNKVTMEGEGVDMCVKTCMYVFQC
jgi:predicted outer membrane repeat protein